MIHIVYTGRGFLVGAFVFGSSLAANLITNWATGSDTYWNSHKWPFGTSLVLSSMLCWFVGSHYQNQKTYVLLNPQTGEKIPYRNSHTFFFIPMKWWGPLLAGTAGIVLALDLSK